MSAARREAVVAALLALLQAIRDHDRKAPPQPARPIFADRQLITRLAPEHSIVTDPIRAALCHSLKRIGRRLHEAGGYALMRTVASEVEQQLPLADGAMNDVLDQWWQGVGRWGR